MKSKSWFSIVEYKGEQVVCFKRDTTISGTDNKGREYDFEANVEIELTDEDVEELYEAVKKGLLQRRQREME